MKQNKLLAIFVVLAVVAIVLMAVSNRKVQELAPADLPSRTSTRSTATTSSTSFVVKPTGHPPCLREDEGAGTENKVMADEGILTVLIGKKGTDKIIISFDVPAMTSNADPTDVRKCGVYAIRRFSNPYSTQLWLYGYDGMAEKKISFSETDSTGNVKVDFQYQFSVDETEAYVALVRGYLGRNDHALVVKNLKTMKDVFVLPAAKLFADYPEIEPGDFNQLNLYQNDFHFQLINTNHTAFDVDMSTWKIISVND